MKKIFHLIFSIVLCQSVGGMGAFFTKSSVKTWYTTLIKPSFNPPDRVFGPAWTILYTLMGISLYLVIETKVRPSIKNTAYLIFGLQLLFNTAWTGAFFGLRSPLYGLVVIVILVVLILLTISQFYRISHLSAYLLIPCFLWVSFATILNLKLYLLNK